MLIAQISDPHVTDADEGVDRRFETAMHLRRAVKHLASLPMRPDLVIVTGDCVDKGSGAEYQRFVDLLRPLEMPVYVIPGNHDDREHMREVWGEQGSCHHSTYIQYVIEEWPVRLMALDTHIPGQAGGELCEERLGWLEARLDEDTSRPTILFQHHPPFALGMSVLDEMGLAGIEALAQLIRRHSNIERILAGHVHCHAQRLFHGTLAVTCPSTAHQTWLDFRPQAGLATVMTPPACLLHFWREDLGLVTYLSPIGDYGALHVIHDGKKWLP